MRVKKSSETSLAKNRRPTQDAESEEPEVQNQAFMAGDFKEEVMTFLWQPWISAGGLTVLDGDPGTGKSSIAFDLAARVTRGRKMPDGTKGKRGSVILMIGEDDPGRLVIPRLKAANADLGKIWFYGSSPARERFAKPLFPTAAAELEKLIRKANVALVVIDPVMSFFPPALNAYVEQDVRRALEPLAAVARSTDAAVLCTRHPSKKESGKKSKRGGGSVAFGAVARTQLWADNHHLDLSRHSLEIAKTNVGIYPTPLEYVIESKGKSSIVVWRGNVERDADDNLADAEEKGKRNALEDAKRLLTLALKDGPKPAKQLLREAEDAGIGSRTLTTAKAAMGVRSRRKADGAGNAFWEWFLPKT